MRGLCARIPRRSPDLSFDVSTAFREGSIRHTGCRLAGGIPDPSYKIEAPRGKSRIVTLKFDVGERRRNNVSRH